MPQVRAKFKVTRVETQMGSRRKKGTEHEYEPCEQRTIVMHPVYGDKSPENKMFWDATPSGEIRVGTVNPEAWQKFELDREYYVDFTLAE